ncbi:ribonuclease BN [Enemella dayhoffiae]|uniref:Ribonuclease BN n=1 Tax=Enemella dayhoffiae TaxID=2016507 RepID=A0A255H4D4_9ACTN|nr:YhjD/YihY/BrkB family envelope integrity protein [Enemella dayhoffiae]OYO21933.1 ribonuclease BN [Enemella dayhoffiae]
MKKFMKHPEVMHVLRASKRFGNRLGNQFGGAITYFSVLAMVPILMFAFAMAGMTLTTLRPDMLDTLKDSIAGQLQGAPGDTKDKLLAVIENALKNWPAIGIVGILSAMYAGGGWVGNLKSAVRAQTRPDFETEEEKSNIVVETLKNMGILVLLLIAVLVTFGIASAATSLTDTLVSAVGLDQVPGITLITRLLSIVVSILAGWLLFLFLYTVLPQERLVKKQVMIGALIGSVALVLLQYLAGILTGSFLKNPAAALFGPVIVIMLFFNLFARLILFVAAWIATANQPAVARKWNDPDEPLLRAEDVNTAEDHWSHAEEDRRQQEIDKADAKMQRAETINKVKDVVPGLEPDPDAEEEAKEEAIQARLDAEKQRRIDRRGR